LRKEETDNVREQNPILPPTAAFDAQRLFTSSLLPFVNDLEKDRTTAVGAVD